MGRNDEPYDPKARLATWRGIARKHISAEMCTRLARQGFEDLAAELMRQRGDLDDVR